MGYYTRYSLEVKCHKDQKEVKELTIENVMNKIQNGGFQEEVLKELELIKNGQENRVIDSDMILRDLLENNENARYALDYNGDSNDSCKWYDSNEEMLKFSKKYPNWLFIMKGEGEESGDLWKRYYLNGKVQEAKAQIVFAEFNEKNLK